MMLPKILLWQPFCILLVQPCRQYLYDNYKSYHCKAESRCFYHSYYALKVACFFQSSVPFLRVEWIYIYINYILHFRSPYPVLLYLLWSTVHGPIARFYLQLQIAIVDIFGLPRKVRYWFWGQERDLRRSLFLNARWWCRRARLPGLLLVYLVLIVKLSDSGLLLECIDYFFVPGPILLSIYLLIPFVSCVLSQWFQSSSVAIQSGIFGQDLVRNWRTRLAFSLSVPALYGIGGTISVADDTTCNWKIDNYFSDLARACEVSKTWPCTWAFIFWSHACQAFVVICSTVWNLRPRHGDAKLVAHRQHCLLGQFSPTVFAKRCRQRLTFRQSV